MEKVFIEEVNDLEIWKEFINTKSKNRYLNISYRGGSRKLISLLKKNLLNRDNVIITIRIFLFIIIFHLGIQNFSFLFLRFKNLQKLFVSILKIFQISLEILKFVFFEIIIALNFLTQ